MRDTERRQLRAYCGVAKIEFEIKSAKRGYTPVGAGPGQIFRDFLVIQIKNYGQTPATRTRTQTGVARTPFLGRLPDGFDYDDHLLKARIQNGFITRAHLNTGEAEALKTHIPDANLIWDAEKRLSSLTVFGRIFYEDAYGRPWSTKFCYVWEPWHPSGARFVPYEEFNGEDQTLEPV